jgi:predicted phosphoribosyltransferase
VTQKDRSTDPGPPTPSTPIAYGEVAAHLRNLATEVTSPEARQQFHALAALYEKLATTSVRLNDAYPPLAEPD